MINGYENPTLVFALALVAATLLSEAAGRSVLSATVIVLIAGLVSGPLGWTHLGPHSSIVAPVAEIALVVILYTDGMEVSVRKLASERRGLIALGFGMPMTILIGTAFARLLVTGSWLHAALLASILSPTDPVLASAIVGQSNVPARVRSLLNVESGLNDGFALPAVIVLLEVAGPSAVEPVRLGVQIVAGVAVGLFVPWAYFRLGKWKVLGIGSSKEALAIIALGLAVFAAAVRTEANVFLAAFFGGIAVRTWAPDLPERAEQVGDVVTDFGKLLAVFIFAAAVSPSVVLGLRFGDYAFVVLALGFARPLALAPVRGALRLDWAEWTVTAWFGPKGFSSLIYALLILTSQVSDGQHLFHVAALTIIASVVAHSSTDTLAAQWLSSRSRKKCADA